VNAVLRSIRTSNPGLYIRQDDAFRLFDTLFNLEAAERELYRRILFNGGIKGRHIALDAPEDITSQDQDQLIERFLRFGRSTAAAAAARALETAGLTGPDIGLVIVNTCTGYLCPGLTSYLAEDLRLSKNTKVIDLMGMGCGGAIPNLETASSFLSRKPDLLALCVSVEICSATIFMEPDPSLVVSNCIFADGAAAAVLQSSAVAKKDGTARFLDFESGLYPEHRDRLQYRTENHRLRNVLDVRVPSIASRSIAQVVDRLLARNGLQRNAISQWIVHPGGQRILDRVRKTFDFDREALAASYEILLEYGNMSSPSVLFVLERVLRTRNPGRGELGILVSFGAGFTVFATLVEFLRK
jgi:alkylresorcinol/alkylpyrone synthase